MANSFLSPPSKRPMSSDPLTPLPSLSNGTSTTTKRPKQPPPPLQIPAGHVSLRMLCHASLIGAFIGKSGSSIKQLQLETGSKIRVEDSLQPGSDDRVILIVAPSTPFKKLLFGDVEYDVSAAQETVVRVFDKVLEVSAEINGKAQTVLFRFLIDETQAGSVIGKGGKVVEKMRKESGAKIRVLLGDHLPPGVSSPDEVVEIEGDAVAVKKALIGVSGRLQECPQGEKPSIKESRPLHSTSQPTVPLSDFRVDSPLQRMSRPFQSTSQPPVPVPIPEFHVDPSLQRMPISTATTSSSPTLSARPLLFENDRFTTSDTKLQQQEVVFKILCSNDRVGGIIGRGGSIVRALQDETGAKISIGATLSNCDERLITITSKEDVESRYSPAQRAVVLVFSRSVEAGVEKGLETNMSKSSSVSARLVVPANQVGCLLGKGGVIVSQMRKATGASISIIRDQVPKCASDDDEVVEISGQFVNVQDALYQVTNRLRNNLLPSELMNDTGSWTNNSLRLDGRVGDSTLVGSYQSLGPSQSIDRQATIRQGLDPLLRPHRLDNSPLGIRTSEVAAGVNSKTFVNLGRGFAANGAVELSSSNRPAIVTNTTVEILVPEDAVSSVYGENGTNLARIRQISGAKVVVHEARPGTRDRTVIISGSPDETQAAQSLLHAFILTGPS